MQRPCDSYLAFEGQEQRPKKRREKQMMAERRLETGSCRVSSATAMNLDFTLQGFK